MNALWSNWKHRNNTLKWIMNATVSVAAQCGRRMSANKPTKRSGSAIMACAMKRIEAPIESTMSVQLLHIPVTWEWKRVNGTMKRIEACIESTMSVQHIPVTWEDYGTQSRFHTLSIRSQYAQVVPFALTYRLYCVIVALPERHPFALVLNLFKTIVKIGRFK